MAIALAAGVSAKKPVTVPVSKLPVAAQNFIAKNFGMASVKYVKESIVDFDVILKNDIELEFYKDGSFKGAESDHKALPTFILDAVPASIKAYVNSKFGNWKMTDVDVKFSGNIEIELEKGKYDAELTFSPSGKILKVDIDD